MSFLSGRFLVGLFSVLSAWSIGCDYLAPEEKGYVTAVVLNLRERPTTQSRVVGRLQRGRELEIVERGDAWLRVSVDEREGWVHGDYVGDAAAVRAALQKDLARRPRARKERPVAQPPQGQTPTQPAQRSADALSIAGMIAGMPDDLVLEEMDPLEGQPRRIGATDNGQVVLEFWGPESDLSRSEIMVTVLGVSDDAVARNAEWVRIFVCNAVPQWNRDAEWIANFMRKLSSRDAGTGGFDARGKSVRFLFIKPLGAIRVTIEKA